MALLVNLHLNPNPTYKPNYLYTNRGWYLTCTHDPYLTVKITEWDEWPTVEQEDAIEKFISSMFAPELMKKWLADIGQWVTDDANIAKAWDLYFASNNQLYFGGTSIYLRNGRTVADEIEADDSYLNLQCYDVLESIMDYSIRRANEK